MTIPYPASPVTVAANPAPPILVQFPAVCFTLTLLTDIAYWQTANIMWQNFSAWLLLAGLVVGGLAVLWGLLALLFFPAVRERGVAWPTVVAGLIAMVLAVLNSFIHSGDGWTGVVPNGLIVSAVTVVVMLVAAWLGRPKTYYTSAGVRDDA